MSQILFIHGAISAQPHHEFLLTLLAFEVPVTVLFLSHPPQHLLEELYEMGSIECVSLLKEAADPAITCVAQHELAEFFSRFDKIYNGAT